MSHALAMERAEPHSMGTWRVVLDCELTGSPAEQVARDLELLDEVAAGSTPDTVRIWRAAQCVVVPRRDTRLDEFSAAAAASAATGWPVVVRDSGGTAFPIGPATVQVSIVRKLPPGRPPSAGALYRQLCEPIMEALLEQAVHTTLEWTHRSMCDGAYNLCAGGRKLAGTAQRQRPLPGGRVAVLAHAALAVGGSPRPMVAAIEAYYGALGRPERFADTQHTTLMECLPGTVTGALESWSTWAITWLERAYERGRERDDALGSSEAGIRGIN